MTPCDIQDLASFGVDGSPPPCGRPVKCHARFCDGKWQKGCGYEGATPIVKNIVAALIRGTNTTECGEDGDDSIDVL